MSVPVPFETVPPALVAAIALNLVGVVVLTAYASRLADARGGATAGSVACRDCGTENDAAYRFCRDCTAELAAVGTNTYSRPRTTDSY